ncbi:MAG: hypothetical protein Q8941_05575 [Bacteroidota bacterium]|nr:hypothetical protein [Bacteroidota bacterium]
MQKLIITTFFYFLAVITQGQSKTVGNSLPTDPAKMTMADMQKLAAMTPAEQQAFKTQMLKAAEEKLKKSAKNANLVIDESVLPTTPVVAPVKDITRLSSLPSVPPSRQELLSQTAKMELALKKVLDPQTVQQAESLVAGKPEKEIQNAAIASWYSNKPETALLLGLKLAQKDPDNIIRWNNLGALFNMTGMENRAVPILQYCLVQKPNSTTVLNNIGQAYLGMGDLAKAGQYLSQCLAADDMHPEANHSMALISMFENNYDKAAQYFSKEMEIAQRRSSLAQLGKSGRRNQVNLAELRMRKMKREGRDNKNFFDEIHLSQFVVPDLPLSTDDTKKYFDEHAGFMQSLRDEFMYWMNAGNLTEEQRKAEGKKISGIYSTLVDELVVDLGNTYIPLLKLFTDEDISELKQMTNDYYKKLSEIACPQAPLVPGAGADLALAYQKKCCDMKKPIADNYVRDYNKFVSARLKLVQGRWKEYINAMISIVQLAPDAGNKKLVYTAVEQYFSFLISAIQAAVMEGSPPECYTKMTTAQADGIIQSNHQFEITCPDWLKLNLSLKYAKLKLDCDAFNIEADVYNVINAGASKEFKTGTSTLYVGAGIDGSFWGVASGEITQQFYIVFDNNNQFSDIGMRGGASGQLVDGAIGAGFGYDISLNGGFNSQGGVKSEWISKFEKGLSFVTK